MLDYMLGGTPGLSSFLSEAAAAASLEAFIWWVTTPSSYRLRGYACGTAGVGQIHRPTSRLQVFEDDEQARGAAAAGGASFLAQGAAAAAAAGICRVLCAEGRYAGFSVEVASGYESSAAEVLSPVELGQAVRERFAAHGMGGPAAQPLAEGVAAAMLQVAQRVRGRARITGNPSRVSVVGVSFSYLTFG